MSEQVSVRQGSQVRFSDVKVGVMRVGVRGERARVQLAVRSPRGEDVIVVDRGADVDLHGAGTLRVVEIHGREGTTRGDVLLSFGAA